MNTPTLDWLEEVEAYCEAVTEGPWRVKPQTALGCKTVQAAHTSLGGQRRQWHEVLSTPGLWNEDEDAANAEFAANARTDLPRALELIRGQRDAMIAAQEKLTAVLSDGKFAWRRTRAANRILEEALVIHPPDTEPTDATD